MDYITYEGLRLFNYISTKHHSNIFIVDYITYEGLRPSSFLMIIFISTVWITLPMRD